MKQKNMILTQSISHTLTFDKQVNTTEQTLEAVDEKGVRTVLGYSSVRVVRELNTDESRKAA